MSVFSKNSKVIELTPENFNKKSKSLLSPVDMTGKTGMIVYSAKWCGHCKRAAPEITRTAAILRDSFPIFNLDCDKYGEFAQRVLNINGFPTIVYIDSKGYPINVYDGGRKTQDFLEDVCKVSKVCPMI